MADMTSNIATGAVSVTKSDSTVLPATLGVYVGSAGDIAVEMLNGTQAVFAAVPAGTILPISVTKVLSTGTAASSILALYA